MHLSLLPWFEGKSQAIIRLLYCNIAFVSLPSRSFLCLLTQINPTSSVAQFMQQLPHSRSSLPRVPVLHMCHPMQPSPCIKLSCCILPGRRVSNLVREFSCCSGNLGSNPTQTRFIFSLQRQPFCYRLCRHQSRRLWSLFRFDGAPKAFALIIKILKKIYEAVPTPRPLFRHFLHDVTESC